MAIAPTAHSMTPGRLLEPTEQGSRERFDHLTLLFFSRQPVPPGKDVVPHRGHYLSGRVSWKEAEQAEHVIRVEHAFWDGDKYLLKPSILKPGSLPYSCRDAAWRKVTVDFQVCPDKTFAVEAGDNLVPAKGYYLSERIDWADARGKWAIRVAPNASWSLEYLSEPVVVTDQLPAKFRDKEWRLVSPDFWIPPAAVLDSFKPLQASPVDDMLKEFSYLTQPAIDKEELLQGLR